MMEMKEPKGFKARDWYVGCECGTDVYIKLRWSDAHGLPFLTVAHRGDKLFEWFLFDSESVAFSARRILTRLAADLSAWTILKEYGMNCGEYWTKINKGWEEASW